MYILKSTHGYNAFSLDKLTYHILKDVYKYSKFSDKDFIKYGLQRGFLTLRMGNDKRLINILYSDNEGYYKSYSHKLFFEKVMQFTIKDNNNMFDNEKQITITVFPSNKHGFKQEVFKNGFNF